MVIVGPCFCYEFFGYIEAVLSACQFCTLLKLVIRDVFTPTANDICHLFLKIDSGTLPSWFIFLELGARRRYNVR